MRLVTYNVTWFDALFDRSGRLIDDGGASGLPGVTRAEQTAALARVFAALDADAVMVIEAPDTSRRRDGAAALEHFAERFGLRARRALLGFVNLTQQEIALLYDPDVLEARHDPRGETDPGAPGLPRFDGTFRIDLDIDGTLDRVQFSKPPLEVAATTRSGRRLRLIGVHAKSKAPHGARDPNEAHRLAIAARRKQLAQCLWLRRRVEADLAQGEALVVMGDLNDGPGLDRFEALFGRSSVEIVLGEDRDAELALFDPHARQALLGPVGSAKPTTARFWIETEDRWLSALLDYIMVSRELLARRPCWRIWHPYEDAGCFGDPPLRDALIAASDHFPVSLDIAL